MAPSPTIPTSFVPKQPVQAPRHFAKSGGNAFLAVSLVLVVLAILSSGGVFAYQKYLENIRDKKQAEVIEAQKNVDIAAIEEFTRTRDRFTEAQKLLNAHVAASQFFDLLEEKTLQNVRFDSLSFTLADDRSAEIRMEGVARTFNALAAQSSLFAGERQIRRAIFSDITVRESDESVTFTLTADLEAELLAMSLDSAPATPAPETEESGLETETAPSEEIPDETGPEALP